MSKISIIFMFLIILTFFVTLVFAAIRYVGSSPGISVNVTNPFRNQVILISAQWNNTPNYTALEFRNGTGTVVNTTFIACGQTNVVADGPHQINATCTGAPSNWTNFTILNLAASAWQQLGNHSIKIWVNDSGNAWNSTSTINFTLWTLGNLSCPFDSYSHILARAGENYTITCLALDTLISGPPGIASALVNVYNNTNLMVSNTTNQSGWATITFPTTIETSYTLVANISNNTSIYVNVTFPFNASSIMFVSNQYNPRPIVMSSSDVTITYLSGGWGQLEPNYSFPLPFVVPNFSGGTFNGMILSSNIYAPLTYQNEMFFKPPTRMEMFAYNFTFNVTYSSSGSRIINITTAMPDAPPDQWGFYKNQTVLPAKFATFSQPPHMKFDNLSQDYQPPNMTVLMKNPDDFSVNITNSTGYTWVINGSQRYNISNMPAPNATFDMGKVVINFSGTESQNYTISLIFGTQDISCFDEFPGGSQNFSDYNFRRYCEQHAGNDPNAPSIGPPKTESTPVYITYQNISGVNIFATTPGQAPPVNTTLTTSFIFNFTNPLLNYTGDKLYAEFRYPLNITEWNGTWYTTNPGNRSFNISENHLIQWWNETSGTWLSINSSMPGGAPNITSSDACTNMTDSMPGSPMNGKNMTMCFRAMMFNLNQTVASDTGRLAGGWVYGADVRLNVSVSNSFKIIDQRNSSSTTMGAAGSSNWYNATIAGGQSSGGSTGGTSAAQSNAGLFKIDDTICPNITRACVSGSTPSTCPNITVRVNNQLYYNWTTGSPLIITSQSSGAQVISIGYSVPAVVAAAPSAGGGGGGAVVSTTKVTLARGNANITVPSIAAGKMANVSITKYEDVAFRQINISVTNSVNNIKIVITKLAGLPASVTHEISGKTYHFIQIDKTNFTDTDVNKVFIKFAVNKTWLTNNGIANSNISLYRWVNNRWNELATTYLSEDATEVFYQVESPGLSYFLIGTKGGEVVAAPPTCTENWSCTEWSACVAETQTRTCTDANNCGTTVNKPAESQSCEVKKEEVEAKEISWAYYSAAAVVLIVIAAIMFIFRKKITPAFLKLTSKISKKK